MYFSSVYIFLLSQFSKKKLLHSMYLCAAVQQFCFFIFRLVKMPFHSLSRVFLLLFSLLFISTVRIVCSAYFLIYFFMIKYHTYKLRTLH